MRIRTIGILSLMAAFSLFVGTDAAEAKSGKKHCSTNHCSKSKKHCCKAEHCCTHNHNSACSVLWKRGDCKTELEMMKAGGLCGTMSGKGPITVFCPTDAAYAKLGKARLEDLKKDPKKLAGYHILPKKLMAADIQAASSVVTKEGESLMTNVKDGKAEVDGCLIIEQDIPCSNGVIHILDQVPVPERGK
ncbi:MAG: fasciclin domain-containing protein [Candidatus Obscuribacterales bacterium]|nr:fasciclin domain-containing protein [Candidatus Obscuribacterales bacterium]